MKNIRIAFLAAMLFGFTAATAQIRPDSTEMRTRHKAKTDMDYVFVKDNVLMIHQDGKNSIMHQNFNLNDGGTTVTPLCQLVQKDNSVLKLQNGDRVYLDGRVKLAKKRDMVPSNK